MENNQGKCMAEEVEVESGRKKIKKKNCTDFHLLPSVFIRKI